MANRMYAKGREWFATGGSWTGATIKAALVSSTYTPDTTLTGDQFLSAIPGGAILTTTAALTGKTAVGGVLRHDVATFAALGSGAVATYVVYYVDTGTAGTSNLLVLDDTGSVSGALPITGTGGAVTLTPDSGANGVAVI